MQYRTHQYSATSFERDLSKGAQEDNKEGTHIAHTSTGIPGPGPHADRLLSHADTPLRSRRVPQLRHLTNPDRARRGAPVVRALPHLVRAPPFRA